MLYRGKHIHIFSENNHLSGIWVTGLLSSLSYIVTTYEGEYGTEFSDEVLVEKDTVGMSTGKKDKNQKEIFQGDVLENEKGTRFEVRYGKFTMYCPVDNCMMENVGFYTVADGYYEDMPLGPTEEYAAVIGNIHDNPELKVDDKYRCLASTEKEEENETIGRMSL